MTAKEKAQQLADNMGNIPDGGFGSIGLYEAKQCALVAVNEIIKVLEEVCDDRGYDPFEAPLGSLEYYKEVKQELEKL